MGSFFLPALLFLMVVPATADGGRPVDRPASRVNDHLWWRQPVRSRRAQPGPDDNGPRTRFVRDEDEKEGRGRRSHKSKKKKDKSAHHDTPTTTARATQSRLPPSSSETSTSTSASASTSASSSSSSSSSSSTSTSTRTSITTISLTKRIDTTTVTTISSTNTTQSTATTAPSTAPTTAASAGSTHTSGARATSTGTSTTTVSSSSTTDINAGKTTEKTRTFTPDSATIPSPHPTVPSAPKAAGHAAFPNGRDVMVVLACALAVVMVKVLNEQRKRRRAAEAGNGKVDDDDDELISIPLVDQTSFAIGPSPSAFPPNLGSDVQTFQHFTSIFLEGPFGGSLRQSTNDPLTDLDHISSQFMNAKRSVSVPAADSSCSSSIDGNASTRSWSSNGAQTPPGTPPQSSDANVQVVGLPLRTTASHHTPSHMGKKPSLVDPNAVLLMPGFNGVDDVGSIDGHGDLDALLVPPNVDSLSVKVDGKWKDWILELSAKERKDIVLSRNLSAEDLADLKISTRRYKRARAQRRYHKKRAIAAGKSYSRPGRPRTNVKKKGGGVAAASITKAGGAEQEEQEEERSGRPRTNVKKKGGGVAAASITKAGGAEQEEQEEERSGRPRTNTKQEEQEEDYGPPRLVALEQQINSAYAAATLLGLDTGPGTPLVPLFEPLTASKE